MMLPKHDARNDHELRMMSIMMGLTQITRTMVMLLLPMYLLLVFLTTKILTTAVMIRTLLLLLMMKSWVLISYYVEGDYGVSNDGEFLRLLRGLFPAPS